MRITRKNALRLWFQYYGNSEYAEDFDGGLMYRDAYDKKNFFIQEDGIFIISFLLDTAELIKKVILSAQILLQMMRPVTELLTGLMNHYIRSKESMV